MDDKCATIESEIASVEAIFMQNATLDVRRHPLAEFLQDHEAHIADLKETRIPEVLTVEGRAEVVVLDTKTYEEMVEELNCMKEVAAVRAVVRKANAAGPREEVPPAEMARRRAVMRELAEETERLGLSW